MKAISTPMLQALIVARVAGTVRLDDSWVGTPAAVVSNRTLMALTNRNMIVRTAEDGVFELTIDGYRALVAAGIITDAMLQAEINDRAEVIELDHAEAVVLDEKRSIARASLSTPSGVVLSWVEIEQAFQAYMDVPAELCGHGIKRGRKCSICIEDAAQNTTLICARSFYIDGDHGICGVKQTPGPRGLHEGPHYDEHRRLWSDYTMPGDRRPRCGISMPTLPGVAGMAEFIGSTRVCNLLLNADGECPDVNHRPVADIRRAAAVQQQQGDGRCPYGNLHTIETCRGCGTEDENGNQISAAVGYDSISAALIQQRDEAERKLSELRCAIAHLVGRWQADSSPHTRLFGNVLDSTLREHR